MIRIQVRLTERQKNTLKALAQERRISMAELIREVVEHVINFPEEISKEEKMRRALSIVGKYIDIDGVTDLSENHDKYLDEIYGSW